jgi:hypothetical protein
MKQICPQKSLEYICEKCEYITNNKKDFNKHLLTAKHKNETNETNLEQDNPNLSPNLKAFDCKCGNYFNSRTTLWRHKKKCSGIKEEPTDKDLIMMLIKENSELKHMVLDVCQKIQPSSLTNTVNSHNVNSHNKTFNLNLFLNETCKDAMNITEFVDSIQLQLSDLENVGKVGYVNGISNIIVKNLNMLDETKRPIHCTDPKREILYVKDEDKWEKETIENKKIRKVIKRVAFKNTKLIPDFKQKYPDCNKSESPFSDQYSKLIIEAMGGLGDNNAEKEDKIIKNIAKKVTIDKSNYSY